MRRRAGQHRRRWIRWPLSHRSAYVDYLDQLEREIQARPWPTAAEIWDPREASTLTDLPCFRPEPGTLPALALPSSGTASGPGFSQSATWAGPEDGLNSPLSPEHQLQVLVFEIKLDVTRIRQIRLELAALGRSLQVMAA